jgi:ribose transport system ATP-binding protein
MEKCNLKVNHIRKTYPGVVALDDVSFELKAGEVHALVGENGAGKSTLIKAISGAINFDSGSIIVDDKEYSQMNPILSRSLGIEVIYQEFNLMPSLTVAENIYLMESHNKGALVNFSEFKKKTQALFDEMNIDIDPGAYVKDLSNAKKQLVEIVKAISKGTTRFLVLDEPTAALTVTEVEVLYESIAKLKKRGVSMIYISHRLEEVFEVSDRVTVLRDGKTIDTLNTAETNTDELIKLMVGRELSREYPARKESVGDVVLSVKNLSANDVHDVSFELRKGEILGFAGLVGAGRTEIIRALYGADKKRSGSVTVADKQVIIRSPSDAMKAGLSLVPEDRKQHGVLLKMRIRNNIVLSITKLLSRFGVVSIKKEKAVSMEYFNKLSVRAPSIETVVENLSGGNQQKVAIAKSLAAGAEIIIFDEPTRGIDVGAKREIYNLMREFSSLGMSIIMISSEMDELLGMSDRLLVIRDGRIVAELDRDDFDQEKILAFASGVSIQR